MDKSNKPLTVLLKQSIEILLLVIHLIIERFLKPLWITIILIVIIIVKNWTVISKVLNSFGIDQYRLIKEYLQVILSLPVVILILGLIFLIKFSQSLRVFLENSKPSQIGPVGVVQSQQSSTTEEVEVHRINNEQGTEFFEFSYLNLFFVLNTKIALRWFYLQPNHASTKDNFLSLYSLPPEILNPQIEKDAIFSALIKSELLESNNSQYKVTEKGKRFLKFIGFEVKE